MTQATVQPARSKKARKGAAVASLVLGIIALAGSPIPILNNATIICGIIGAVFGIIALFGRHLTMGMFGLVMSIAGIVIGIALQIKWAHDLDDLKTKVNQDLSNIQSSVSNMPAPTIPRP